MAGEIVPPSFLRRKTKLEESSSDISQYDDPRVHQFLGDFLKQQDNLRAMAADSLQKDRQISKLEDHNVLLRADVDRRDRQLTVSLKVAAEQKIYFGVALTSALSAKEHAKAAIESTYKQADVANTATFEQAKAAYEQAKVVNYNAYKDGLAAINAAFDPFVEAAHAAQKSIEQELRKAGLQVETDPPDPATEEKVNLAAEAIGRQFGANSRRKSDKDDE